MFHWEGIRMRYISIALDRKEREAVEKPVTGARETWGGFQHLLVRLQGGLKINRDGVWVLRMTEQDANRAMEYTDESHGPGGYQARIRVIRPKVRRALEELNATGPEQGGFGFDEPDSPAQRTGFGRD